MIRFCSFTVLEPYNPGQAFLQNLGDPMVKVMTWLGGIDLLMPIAVLYCHNCFNVGALDSLDVLKYSSVIKKPFGKLFHWDKEYPIWVSWVSLISGRWLRKDCPKVDPLLFVYLLPTNKQSTALKSSKIQYKNNWNSHHCFTWQIFHILLYTYV